MRKYYAPPIVVTALVLVVLFSLQGFSILQSGFFSAYSTKFQVPLFTGFLTISGFLLSLATFIIVRMHDSVYRDEDYLSRRVGLIREFNPEYSPTKPLKQLSNFLIFCVASTLFASFAQFTIGTIDHQFATIFCIGVAAGAGVCVALACVLIKKNITAWMGFMDEKLKPGGETAAK